MKSYTFKYKEINIILLILIFSSILKTTSLGTQLSKETKLFYKSQLIFIRTLSPS